MNLAQALLNIGKGVVHPFAQTGTALAYTPKAMYRLAQNKPIDDIQRRVFGTNDQGAIARNIIGNTAQVGLSLALPAAKGLTALQGLKYGAQVGAAGGVASGFADTGKPIDMLQRGAMGGALGGLIGGATPLARALYLRGRAPGFNVTNGMDATFGPKPEFQIKAGVPLQNNPLKKGFEIVDNNPQPFKIIDNSVPYQQRGAVRQAQLSKEPLDDTTAAYLERAQVRDYIKSKPVVKGSALTGEGAKLPSDVPLSPLARAKAITEARTKVGPTEIPKTVKVFTKSKFREGGGYSDIPVIRRVENKTLYQGGSADGRQFWTANKKYAEQFGKVTKKTGTFYEVDNGNRVTTVYVDANQARRK